MELFLWAIESTIVNSVAIVPALLFFGYLLSSLLVSLGAKLWVRAVLYSLIGTGFGIWSYSAFDAIGRSLEAWEFAFIFSSMFVFSALLVSPVLFLKNRKAKNSEKTL